MPSKYGKGTLAILIIVGLIVGFCAGIVFYNLLIQGAFTLHLEFGWNATIVFIAVCFSIAGAGVGWAIWHSISRENGQAHLPPGVAALMFLGVGVVIVFLWLIVASMGLLSG